MLIDKTISRYMMLEQFPFSSSISRLRPTSTKPVLSEAKGHSMTSVRQMANAE